MFDQYKTKEGGVSRNPTNSIGD